MQCAASIPHSDAAGQDALDGASVEGAHDGGGGWCSLQLAEEVEAPLGLLGQWCGIGCSGEILTDVNPQELGAARSLHSSTVNVQTLRKSITTSLVFSMFRKRLVSLHYVASWLTFLQWVSSLLDMRPTTVVSSANFTMWFPLNDGAQWGSSVKSRGLSTQTCGAPVLRMVALDVLLPTRAGRGLSLRKSSSQLHRESLSRSWSSLPISC